jgi:hypothetical protein
MIRSPCSQAGILSVKGQNSVKMYPLGNFYRRRLTAGLLSEGRWLDPAGVGTNFNDLVLPAHSVSMSQCCCSLFPCCFNDFELFRADSLRQNTTRGALSSLPERGSSNHRTKILKANYALGKLSQAVDTSVTVQFGSGTALDFGRPGFAPRLRGGPPITARSRLMA